jgi:hypothetical protein
MERGLMAKDDWGNLGLDFDKMAKDRESVGTEEVVNGGKQN